MNSVVEDIKDMLVADTSLGLTFGTNLHLYREPSEPDNVVSVFEAPGMPPIELLNSNEDDKHYERPSIQVRVRNLKAQDAFELAYKILYSLHARSQQVWGDYLYSVIYTMSNPDMLDWDANNRVRVVVNFMVQRRLI